MEHINIKGWSIDIKGEESDHLVKGQVNVYFNGRKQGTYDNGKLFDAWYRLGKSTVIPVDVKFDDFFTEDYMMDRYQKDCKEWHSYLEEQFGEEISGQESLVTTLVKLEELLVPDTEFLLGMELDFVLLYSREVTTDESKGKELVGYKITGYDVIAANEYTEEYVNEYKEKGIYPIRLTHRIPE